MDSGYLARWPISYKEFFNNSWHSGHFLTIRFGDFWLPTGGCDSMNRYLLIGTYLYFVSRRDPRKIPGIQFTLDLRTETDQIQENFYRV